MRRPARSLAPALLALALVVAAPAPAIAAPGDLDTTFSTDGQQTVDFGGSTDESLAVEPSPTKRIVVAGKSGDGTELDVAVARLLPNGVPDTSFSGDGRTTVGDGSIQDFDNALAVMRDERIVVAGGREDAVGQIRGFVARLKANGNKDTSFSGDGQLSLNLGTGDAYFYDVLVRPDDKIVLVGEYYLSDTNSAFLLVRLKPNGTKDTTFGGDGVVMTPFLEGSDGALRIALTGDGKIVAAGWTESSGDYAAAVARYHPDGRLDRTFNGDGKIIKGFATVEDAYVTGLDLFGGKVYVSLEYSTSTDTRMAVLRLTSSGRVDDTFNTDGVATLRPDGMNSESLDVEVQSDGKIVLGGSVGDAFAIVRLRPGGRLEREFGTDGVARAPLFSERAVGVELQSNGRILAVDPGRPDFQIARFLP